MKLITALKCNVSTLSKKRLKHFCFDLSPRKIYQNWHILVKCSDFYKNEFSKGKLFHWRFSSRSHFDTQLTSMGKTLHCWSFSSICFEWMVGEEVGGGRELMNDSGVSNSGHFHWHKRRKKITEKLQKPPSILLLLKRLIACALLPSLPVSLSWTVCTTETPKCTESTFFLERIKCKLRFH